VDPAAFRRALDDCYAGVPATECANSGDCCRLTEEEYRDHYATMFPLYRAEYLNIVDFVQRELKPGTAAALLDFREERPRQCPFLGNDNRCTIYRVRPLICRTYGVMRPETIERVVAEYRDRVPQAWLRRFARREGSMFCPRVRVLEPARLSGHAERLLWSVYTRELSALSRKIRLLDDGRLAAFRALTGRDDVPLRWSWGGFNTLCSVQLTERNDAFRNYWAQAVLADCF